MQMTKDMENIKGNEEKAIVMYKETPIRIYADFSAETAGQEGKAQYS